MTRRKYVLEALNHRETDKIPYHVEFTQQALDQLIAYTQDPEIENKLGGYLHYAQYWGWPTEIPNKPEHFKDEFGVEWNRSGADKDIGVVENPLITDLEECDYQFPQPDIARLRRDIEKLISTKEDKFTFFGFGFCMFERSWSLMGMENALISMITCPEKLENLYDQICEYFLQLIDVALEYDIDAVYFGDDWGQQKGLIMGAEHWRRFIKPRMARLYQRVKENGKFVIQHSCGDCHEIFPDLLEIGLDCYQTFQPEIYDIQEMKTLYGDKLTFWGGISTQRALPLMEGDALKTEIRKIAGALKQNGGLIIAPTHAIPFDVTPENILTMIDIFRKQDF